MQSTFVSGILNLLFHLIRVVLFRTTLFHIFRATCTYTGTCESPKIKSSNLHSWSKLSNVRLWDSTHSYWGRGYTEVWQNK